MKRLHFAFENSIHHYKRGEVHVAQFVYTMHRVGKVVPPKRHILKTSH